MPTDADRAAAREIAAWAQGTAAESADPPQRDIDDVAAILARYTDERIAKLERDNEALRNGHEARNVALERELDELRAGLRSSTTYQLGHRDGIAKLERDVVKWKADAFRVVTRDNEKLADAQRDNEALRNGHEARNVSPKRELDELRAGLRSSTTYELGHRDGIAKLERERDRLRDINKGFLWLLDQEALVRNTDRDGESDFTSRAFRFGLWLCSTTRAALEKDGG